MPLLEIPVLFQFNSTHMPIEIKELHIKAIVADKMQESKVNCVDIDLLKMKKELVKECVQEIMEKLKEKNER